MKRSLISSIILSILILTACLSPSGGVSTPTATSAPSETPSPAPTETPTPTPESLLPQQVQEKFNQAGINLKDMQNAQYDKNGLHITLESGEVIVLTNDQLQKGMYNGQDNVLQYRDQANQNVIYAFDKETGKWGVDISGTEAGAATVAILNELKVDLSTIELKMDGEEVVCIERATGNEVCRDGKFELHFVQESLVASGDLMPTKYKPAKEGVAAPVGANWSTNEVQVEYLIRLNARWRREYIDKYGVDPYEESKSVYTPLMLDPEKLAWGSVWAQKDDNGGIAWRYLIYEKVTGEVGSILLMDSPSGSVLNYWLEK